MISVKENIYQYTPAALLGSGTFGNVFKCVRTTDKKEFAIKTIDRLKLVQQGDYLLEALEREIATQTIATQSEVPFFVGLYDHFEDEKTIYMIMELCEFTLTKHIEGKKLTEQICLDLIYQVGLGLDYLHSIGICHRDIKLENILIKKCVLKIADFGFATQSKVLSTHLGTKPYMSPEFFLNGDDDEYTPKIDVWALNTCFYYLLTKKYFFYSHNQNEMEKQITRKEFTIEPTLAFLSKEVQELLKAGYIKNPHKRPTMREYISHPAFDETRKNYMSFPPNCKTASIPDLNFDNLKNEERLSLDQNQNLKVLSYLLNFRNNLLVYSQLAKCLQEKQFSRVLVFLLIKRHLQELTMMVLFLKAQETPSFGPFALIVFDKNSWSNFVKSPIFNQVSSLFLFDLKKLTGKYSQVYKDILNSMKEGIDLPSYDLNVDYKKEINRFCESINSKIQVIIAKKSSPELDKIGKMLQLVMLYEGGDELRMVSGLNKVEN